MGRPAQRKYCRNCDATKPVAAFSVSRRAGDGLQTYCKVCCKILMAPTVAKNKASGYHLKKYGVTKAWYDAKFAEQGGVCGICKKACRSGRNLAVDHDHKTGMPRGLLCIKCNIGIGNLDEDIVIVTEVIAYLRKWQLIAAGVTVTVVGNVKIYTPNVGVEHESVATGREGAGLRALDPPGVGAGEAPAVPGSGLQDAHAPPRAA